MRAHAPADMLKYEVMNKPHVAAFVARAAYLSDTEVMNAEEKGIMKWMKQEIVASRKRIAHAEHMADVSANLTDHIVDGVNGDPLGMMCMWNGDDQFVNLHGGSGCLMLRYGDLIWFAKSGGVWLDTVFTKVIDPKLSNVIPQGEVTKTAYSEVVRQRRLRNAPASLPHTVVAGAETAPVSPLAALGVRFQ